MEAADKIAASKSLFKPFKKNRNLLNKKTAFPTFVIVPKLKKCKLCDKLHFNQCKSFYRLSYNERLCFVKEQKLCMSSLEIEHYSKQCNNNISKTNPTAHDSARFPFISLAYHHKLTMANLLVELVPPKVVD